MERWVDYLLPETWSAPAKARKRYVRRTLIAGFALGLAIGASLHERVPEALLLTAVPLIVYLVWEFAVLLRALDELQSRIHVTALAVAGGVVCTAMTLIGVIALIWTVDAPGLSFALPVLGLVYYVALFIVSRRYA